MGLLCEVLKLSPWHIQRGWSREECFSLQVLFTYILPQTGVGRIQSHRAVRARAYSMCVCGGKVNSSTAIRRLIEKIEKKIC